TPLADDVAVVTFPVINAPGTSVGTRTVTCVPSDISGLWDCNDLGGGQGLPQAGGNTIAILVRPTPAPPPPGPAAPLAAPRPGRPWGGGRGGARAQAAGARAGRATRPPRPPRDAEGGAPPRSPPPLLGAFGPPMVVLPPASAAPAEVPLIPEADQLFLLVGGL